MLVLLRQLLLAWTIISYLETFVIIAPLLVLFASGAVAILLPPDDLSGQGLPTHGGRGTAIFGDIMMSDGHGRGFIVKVSCAFP